MNWTERLAKVWNLGNAKLQTRNCGLRFAVYLMLKVSIVTLLTGKTDETGATLHVCLVGDMFFFFFFFLVLLLVSSLQDKPTSISACIIPLLIYFEVVFFVPCLPLMISSLALTKQQNVFVIFPHKSSYYHRHHHHYYFYYHCHYYYGSANDWMPRVKK